MTKYKTFSTLFGGILYHFVVGNGNTFSNMNTYITSYLRKNSSPDLTYAHSVWFNAVGVTGFSLATFIAGYLTNKIGTRLTCLIGSIIFS